MYDDTLVQGAHVHGLPRVGCLPGLPPVGGMPAPLTAREIATVADARTYWYFCQYPLNGQGEGERVRSLLRRERDWYARHGVPLPAGRDVLYALNGVSLSPEATS